MSWRPIHPTRAVVAVVAASALTLAACSGGTTDAVETGADPDRTATSAPSGAGDEAGSEAGADPTTPEEAGDDREAIGSVTADDDGADDDGQTGGSEPDTVPADELTDDEKAALAVYLMTPEERAEWAAFIEPDAPTSDGEPGDLGDALGADDGEDPAPAPPPAGPPIPPDVLARLSPGAIVVYIDPNGTVSDPGVMAGNTGVQAPGVASDSVWDRLAFCESSGNWSINTGNGYHGGLQFDPRTWVSYGGLVYATEAWQASREQQIDIARRVLFDVGWGAWPACTLKLGLR